MGPPSPAFFPSSLRFPFGYHPKAPIPYPSQDTRVCPGAQGACRQERKRREVEKKKTKKKTSATRCCGYQSTHIYITLKVYKKIRRGNYVERRSQKETGIKVEDKKGKKKKDVSNRLIIGGKSGGKWLAKYARRKRKIYPDKQIDESENAEG